MSLLLDALKKAEAAKRAAGRDPSPPPAAATAPALSLAPVDTPIPTLDERPPATVPDFSAFTLELAPVEAAPVAAADPPPAPAEPAPLPDLDFALPPADARPAAPPVDLPPAPVPLVPAAPDYSDELPPPAAPPVRPPEPKPPVEDAPVPVPAPALEPRPDGTQPPATTAPEPAAAPPASPPPASPAQAQRLLQATAPAATPWLRRPQTLLYAGLGLLLVAVVGWLLWQWLEPEPAPPPRPAAANTPPAPAPTPDAAPAADPLADLGEEADPVPPPRPAPAASTAAPAIERDAPLFRSRLGRDGSRIIVASQDELGAELASRPAAPPLPPAAAPRPDPAAAAAEQAMRFSRSGNWTQSQEAWFTAVRLAPANADYAFNLAVSLDHLGAGGEAARHYRQAAALAAGGRAGFDPARAQARADELESDQ